MPIGKVGLSHRAYGGTPIAVVPPNPCDLPIGPGNLASDCHTAAGIIAWYKSDTIVGAFETPITTIPDQSGNARHAVQATVGCQDLLHNHPTNMPTIWGQPYTLDNPNNPGFYPFSYSQSRGNLTVYAVIQQELNNPIVSPFVFTNNIIVASASIHGGIIFDARLNTSSPYDPNASTVSLNASKNAFVAGFNVSAPALCGWQVLTAVLDASNSLMSIYRNGSLLASAAYTAFGTETDVSWSILGTGCNRYDSFEGNVTEIQVYNAVHSAATIATKSSCLKTRWGF